MGSVLTFLGIVSVFEILFSLQGIALIVGIWIAPFFVVLFLAAENDSAFNNVTGKEVRQFVLWPLSLIKLIVVGIYRLLKHLIIGVVEVFK